jgi:hypothetical protein
MSDNENISNGNARVNSVNIEYYDYQASGVDTTVSNEVLSTLRSSRVDTKNVEFKLGLRVCPVGLAAQSIVFSKSMLCNRSPEIKYYHIFGYSKYEDQNDVLSKLYIYSFVKAYILAMSSQHSSMLYGDNPVLYGHSMLHSCILRKKTFSSGVNGVSVTNNLIITEDEHQANLDTIFDNFKFLGLKPNSDSVKNWSVPLLESQILSLSSKLKENWANFDLLNNKRCGKDLIECNNPIGNAFYSDSKLDSLLYIRSVTSVKAASYCFSRSNFIYLKSKDVELISMYQRIVYPEFDVMTKHDVHSISSVRPRFDHDGFATSNGTVKYHHTLRNIKKRNLDGSEAADDTEAD